MAELVKLHGAAWHHNDESWGGLQWVQKSSLLCLHLLR